MARTLLFFVLCAGLLVGLPFAAQAQVPDQDVPDQEEVPVEETPIDAHSEVHCEGGNLACWHDWRNGVLYTLGLLALGTITVVALLRRVK